MKTNDGRKDRGSYHKEKDDSIIRRIGREEVRRKFMGHINLVLFKYLVPGHRCALKFELYAHAILTLGTF